jgi:hypothetical protein
MAGPASGLAAGVGLGIGWGTPAGATLRSRCGEEGCCVALAKGTTDGINEKQTRKQTRKLANIDARNFVNIICDVLDASLTSG